MFVDSWVFYLVLLLIFVFMGFPILREHHFKAPWSAWLLFGSVLLALALEMVGAVMTGGLIARVLDLSGIGVILLAALISGREFRKLAPAPSKDSLAAGDPDSLGPDE